MKHKIIAIIMMLLPIQTLWGFGGSGFGTSGDPYLVTSAAQLDEVRNDLTAYYKQMNNIDLSSYSNWTPIGSTSTICFTGTYDGNGYKITGLTITSTTANTGLFGFMDDGTNWGKGTIKNVGVVSANITSTAVSFGILVGNNSGGIIQNCYTSGTITSSANNVGGLAGANRGTISNCYSSATVNGSASTTMNVGGLVGTQTGFTGQTPTIQNCYATGTVTGNTNVGGFIGNRSQNVSNIITNCYSTGHVTGTTSVGGFAGIIGGTSGLGSTTNCFWDITTSGQSSSSGGGEVGKSTSEMKTQSIFTGWDFTSTWEIITGNYPRLKSIPDPALPVELSSFTAVASNNSAALAWKTATEENNYGFEIERRVIQGEGKGEKVEWRKVGFVAGNGTSNTEHTYSYSDANISSGTYAYRLKQIDNGGTFKYSSETEVTISIPKVFALNQNYPNPFNPTTTFTFTLVQDGFTTLKIYNVLGKEVATLVNGEMKAGMVNTVTFNAFKLSSGVYFSRLENNGSAQIKKMLMIK